MAETRIKFGDWLPDQPGIVGALTVASNIYPVANGYAPFPSSVTLSDAASEDLNNVFAAKFSGTTTLFAGGASKLFKYDAGDLDLDDVSKMGGYSTSGRWYFVQFGKVVLAVNNSDKVQAWTLGTSTAFADVAAGAPIAKFITVVRDFVVCAGISSTSYPNRVQWSDINDETDWTSGSASQADSQDLPDGGDIKGITGGEFGLILSERAITRMNYSGSPFFFQFDVISRGLGCLESNSIAQYNGLTFFLSDDGFYMCDGQSVKGIGAERVDRYFFDNANPSEYSKMSAAVDPIRRLVVWEYVNDVGGKSLLIYNWQLDKWSAADTTVDRIASAASSSATLEQLDNYGTVDSIQTSWDDKLWVGGQLLMFGCSGTRLTTFSGPATNADITTSDLGDGKPSVVMLVRPMVDNGSASVSVASRTLLNEQPSFGTSVVASSENRCSLRSAGRYHRVKVVPSGDNWTTAVGIDVDIVSQGVR